MESKLCNRFVIERVTKNYNISNKGVEKVKKEILEYEESFE